MAFTLTDDAAEFVANTISNASSLLDNVHCYDTEEAWQLDVAGDLMRGLSLEEALANNPESENGEDE
jgi:hypothetical protein